jgi:guanosine-3',5'-bis(diphosphate) 3'-pyrophosphohydrolase
MKPYETKPGQSIAWSPDVFAKAWNFATLKHHGQTYSSPLKGVSFDYINHVGIVAVETIWALTAAAPGSNADLAIQCALLHDVIEDTSGTYEDILEQFGKDVADGVQALTKDDRITDKIEKMAECLVRICAQPAEIWMVKMADRIVNLSPPPFSWTCEKIASYRQEAIQIYDALHTANPVQAARLWGKIEQFGSFLNNG